MEQSINTANYLRDVEDIIIDIHNLPVNDKLLWNEVEKLLKDNDLWDDKCGYYKHTKRIYVITTEHYDFNVLIKNKNLCADDITKEVLYPTSNSLYNYMYRPAFTENYFNTNESKWCLELPFEGNECKTYNYIIILLVNDNVIVGRYGSAFWGLGCYYHNETKQVPFDKLNEPYKSLIIKKLLEENDITKNDITKEEIKKYKKNYPQEHEEIIKTEIPPSNWGPGYWEILKKIIEENEKQGKN